MNTRLRAGAAACAFALACTTMPAYATPAESPPAADAIAPGSAAPATPTAEAPPSASPAAVPGTPSETAQGKPAGSGVQVTLASPLAAATDAHAAAMAQAELQMSAMQNQYGSLSTSLAGYYAAQSNLAVGEYIASSVSVLASASGVTAGATPEQLSRLAASANSATSMSDVNSLIVGAGVGIDFSRFTSMQEAIAEMRANSSTLDASVTSAAALWGQQMLSMTAPTLEVPPTPVLSLDTATSMPAEGLAFGMFTNRSINTLVSNFPDVFGYVNKKGFKGVKGSKGNAARSAWKRSVDATAATVAPQLRSLMTGECGTAFVNGLTGSAAGDCSPCSASGLYAYSQLVVSGPNGPGASIPIAANPALSGSVAQALSPDGQTACANMSGTVQREAGKAAVAALAALK